MSAFAFALVTVLSFGEARAAQEEDDALPRGAVARLGDVLHVADMSWLIRLNVTGRMHRGCGFLRRLAMIVAMVIVIVIVIVIVFILATKHDAQGYEQRECFGNLVSVDLRVDG